MLTDVVAFFEYGPGVLDPVRPAARMKRLRWKFRFHVIQVDFTQFNRKSKAWRRFERVTPWIWPPLRASNPSY